MDIFEPIDCALCGAENSPEASLMGTLGYLEWHRCRYCGGVFYDGQTEPEETCSHD